MTLTASNLFALPYGFPVKATDVAKLSGRSQQQGIHPLLDQEPQSVIILCTVEEGVYPNRWLNRERTELLYYLQGIKSKKTGEKRFRKHYKVNLAVSNSTGYGYPIHVFWRRRKPDPFVYEGQYRFISYEEMPEGALAFRLGKIGTARTVSFLHGEDDAKDLLVAEGAPSR